MSRRATLFVTLLAANARERLIAAISTKFQVKQVGWTVDNPAETLCVLHVFSNTNNNNIRGDFEGLFDLIRDAEVQFHSLVLYSGGATLWDAGNIDYSKIEAPPKTREPEPEKGSDRYSLITQDE